MPRRAPPGLAIAFVFAGCNAPALENFSAGEPDSDGGHGTSTAGTSLTPAPTDGGGDGSTGTTDAPGTTTIGSSSTGEVSGTTGELAPPAIVDHQLAPLALQQPGPITVNIDTAHADGVRMQVDDGDLIELSPAGPDAFTGEIVFHTGLDNDDPEATFTAWRDALESAPLVVPFTVALPAPGSELYWDGDNDLGPGVVVALAVTPSHDVIELGTYYPMGQARCYLRRRDLGGAWGPGDLVEVLPGTLCTAIDLAVDEDGALHVLANRLVDGELRWWLGKISTWGADPDKLGAGTAGDAAFALALDSARAAVCGTMDKQTELDAAAWIFSPNQPGKVLSFDYESPKPPFDETARDCLFSGNSLVVAGHAYGQHDNDTDDRERHFLLEVDLSTNQGTWTVSGPGPGTQSKALALAVDLDGRYITAGYTCEDTCEPRAELRMFLPGGVQIWQKTLDPVIQPPRAIAWSPADYIVYVSARDVGQGSTSFFAEAWFLLHGVPLWSYAHVDAPAIHAANTLVIGPYGQIYAGGMTAGGYPAFAIIAP